jgi:hypothetical protein
MFLTYTCDTGISENLNALGSTFRDGDIMKIDKIRKFIDI